MGKRQRRRDRERNLRKQPNESFAAFARRIERLVRDKPKP